MTERHSLTLTNDASVAADPFATVARWRAAGPAHRATTPAGEAVWLVTRYDDVRRLLADPRLSLDKTSAEAGGYRGFALPPALDANLLNMDPPQHTRLRRLVSTAFTARRVQRLQPVIDTTVHALIDAVIPAGRADLVTNLAAPLPLTVIGDLLGVPKSDRDSFRAGTTDLITPPSPAAAVAALTTIEGLLRDIIARKRHTPSDDLISAMVAARDDHDHLDEDELTSLAFLILWAGYETTVDLLSVGTLSLLEHRDQFDRLRAHPELADNAVDELLRWTAPTPYAIRRFTTEALTVGDVRLPAGATVLLCLTSAHRDPAHFAAPDNLDITRTDASAQVGFGHGPHYCLGAPLARLEVSTALRALTRRLPNLQLDGDSAGPRWRPSFRSRGLLSLPVTF